MSAAIVEQPFNASLDHLIRPISTAVMPLPTISSLHEDIVALVFAEFNTSDPAERAACAQGALVCRAWAEPALRALWRSLRSLLPLYAVLLPVPRTVRKTYIGRWYIEYIGEASVYFLLNEFK